MESRIRGDGRKNRCPVTRELPVDVGKKGVYCSYIPLHEDRPMTNLLCRRWIVVLGGALILCACGGGGSGGAATRRRHRRPP